MPISLGEKGRTATYRELAASCGRAAALLARALLAQDRFEEAETLSHESEALAGPFGGPRAHRRELCLVARYHLERGPEQIPARDL